MAKHLSAPAPIAIWDEADSSPRGQFNTPMPRHREGGPATPPYVPFADYVPFAAPVSALVHVNQLPAQGFGDNWDSFGRTP